MTEGMASRRQVVVGVVLGILLLPLPVVLEFAYFHGTERTLDVVFHAMVFFGAIQAFAILPASLCFYVAGKHGVVRGLLYFGTFAALCNTVLWVFVYRGLFNARIY
jgi:hypothetical protein